MHPVLRYRFEAREHMDSSRNCGLTQRDAGENPIVVSDGDSLNALRDQRLDQLLVVDALASECFWLTMSRKVLVRV
ncbi:MAG: hypothetical protein IH827_00550 [Myxococcales bacterium]|nr:hypothetical protein [Myxococcales bacterium]